MQCTALLILFPVCTKGEISRDNIDSLNAQAKALILADPGQADSIAQVALEHATAQDYKQGIADANMRLGSTSLISNDFEQAIQRFQKAIELRKEHDSNKKLASAYTGLANALFQYGSVLSDSIMLEFYSRAEDYILRALNILEKSNETEELVNALFVQGMLKGANGEINESQKIFKRCFTLSKTIGDSSQIARSAQDISKNYFDLELYDSMSRWIDSSTNYVCQECHEIKLINALNLGSMFYELDQVDSAFKYYTIAEELADKHGYKNHLPNIYRNFGGYYLYTKDFLMAAVYFEARGAILDSALIERKHQFFAAAHEQFHTSEITRKNHELAIEKRRNMIIAILLGALLITAFFLYRNQRQKLKVKSLDALINGQESERERIANDLHDRLGSMLGALKLQMTTIGDKFGEAQTDFVAKYNSALNLLDSASTAVHDIAYDLKSITLIREGMVAALFKLKQDYEVSGKVQINLFPYGLEKRLDPTLELTLYRIIQELVNNAVKHSNCKKIDIHLTKDEKSLVLIVEDDGDGFDPDKAQMGLGLKNIKQRSLKINASFKVDSTVGKGTSVIIETPLNHEK